MAHKFVYYYRDIDRDLLVFSTELKAVLAHPSVPRQLDESVLPIYLSLGSTAAPFTLAKGVRKLRPAECISFSRRETRVNRYWRPAIETGPDDFDYWVSRTREELVRAVRRTVGDAEKVGVYLSGGLDSSVVLAALRQSKDIDVRAFTLAYNQHESEYDIAWAERVAKATGTPQQTITIDPEVDLSPRLVTSLLRQIDDPFESVGRSVSGDILGRAGLAAGFDSMLSGGSAAVLFTLDRLRGLQERGMPSGSLAEALSTVLGGRSFRGERLNRALVQPADRQILHQAAIANAELLEGLNLVQALEFARIVRMPTSRVSFFFEYAPPLLGIEERSPFLDTQFASFAVSMPPKFRGFESADFDHAPLKQCFRETLQVDFSQREKRVFPSLPLPPWLRQAVLPRAEAIG